MKSLRLTQRLVVSTEVPWKLHSPAQVKRLLRAHGIAALRRLGQHFLIDDNIVRKIVVAAALEPSDVVLEIGPGLGILTRALAPLVNRLVALEKDPRCCEALRDTVGEYDHVQVLQGDALEVDWRKVVGGDVQFKLISNLPYQISKPVLRRMLDQRDCLKRAVLMMQREVADRLTATPGSKTYGILSVASGLFAQVDEITSVSPNSFLPPPKVHSTVVRVTFPTSSLGSNVDESFLMRVVSAAFHQRRKTLLNSLSAGLFGGDSSRVRIALAAVEIEGTRRAETLFPEEFVRLAAELAHEMPHAR